MRSVRMYSKPRCILCAQVLKILSSEGIRVSSTEVRDPMERTRLLEHFGVATFPVVLVGDRVIGGFSHVVHLLADGRLDRALALDALDSRAASEKGE